MLDWRDAIRGRRVEEHGVLEFSIPCIHLEGIPLHRKCEHDFAVFEARAMLHIRRFAGCILQAGPWPPSDWTRDRKERTVGPEI